MDRRINWIDWLKVLVVFGVFLYHAAQPFVVTTWLVNAPERSMLLSGLAGAGYLFGMPLMFLLAGSATWLALRRRGTAGFVGLRVRRLLLPLIAGIALLSPAQAWVAAGDGRSFPAFLAAFWGSARVSLNPQWLGDYGYHLWFLGFLFAYSIICLPFIDWLRGHAAAAGRVTSWVASRRSGLALGLLPVLVPQLVLRPLAPAYRDWADFGLWLAYFAIGIVAAADTRLVDAIVRGRWAALAAIGLLAVAFIPVALSGSALDLEHAPGLGPTGLAYVALRVATGWAMVLVFIGFAARHLTVRPRALGWASRAVLPFYVLHHPVIVVVAVWVLSLQMPLWPAFGLICAISLPLTLAIYELGRRLAMAASRAMATSGRAPVVRLPGAGS